MSSLAYALDVMTPVPASLSPAAIREEAAGAPGSGIVDVYNYGYGREGLIPLWVGEGDLPTPQFIIDAATRSLAAGETFYTYQRGVPGLRDAIARYMTRLYGVPLSRDRFFVTAGGMHALQIALRIVAGNGDDVLVPTPAWPNFAAAIGITGARPVAVPMTFSDTGWQLDMDRLSAAVSPSTRAIIINSPSNPTGWTATLADLKAVLDLARRHGLWIIADEIYAQFTYGAPRAPSIRDLMDADDRVLFVQTFSKNWAMTGWRIGWLEAPEALGHVIENLIQYSSSGSPVFVQKAAIAALDEGDAFIAQQAERCMQSRAIVCEALSGLSGVSFAQPTGAFYLFFSLGARQDTTALAKRMIDEALVGLAPGTAFGSNGDGWFRLCYARDPRHIALASERLRAWISAL
jgi:aspartate/methionine/tyrosine aminotransferase